MSEALTCILPGTWVFHHKNLPSGEIKKYKGRHCVRSDLHLLSMLFALWMHHTVILTPLLSCTGAGTAGTGRTAGPAGGRAAMDMSGSNKQCTSDGMMYPYYRLCCLRAVYYNYKCTLKCTIIQSVQMRVLCSTINCSA